MLPYQRLFEEAWSKPGYEGEENARRQFLIDLERLPDLLEHFHGLRRKGQPIPEMLRDSIAALIRPSSIKKVNILCGLEIHDYAAELANMQRARVNKLRRKLGEEDGDYRATARAYSKWCKKVYAATTTPYEHSYAVAYIKAEEHRFDDMIYHDRRPPTSLTCAYFDFVTNLPTDVLVDVQDSRNARAEAVARASMRPIRGGVIRDI